MITSFGVRCAITRLILKPTDANITDYQQQSYEMSILY